MKIDWKEKEKLIKGYHDKMTIADMAKKLNINYQTLYKKILRMRKEGKLPPANTKEHSKERNNIKSKIAELDGNIELGRKYHVKKFGSKDKFTTKNFIGELIQITDTFYTFKNRNRAESYLKIDFIIGDYQISEVK